MNYGLLHALAMPRGRALAVLAAAAVIAMTMPARAQQPAPAPAAPKAAPKPAAPAAPKAAPKQQQQTQQTAPQQQAQPQQGQQEQIQLIYSPWTKFCLKPQDNAKQVCFTGKDGRIESGQPVIAAVIIEPEGEPKKLLRVTLPLGMQLVPGTRVIVDNNAPQQSPYVICLQNGCMSDYEVTADLIANMKKGQTLYVQAIHGNTQPLTLPLPLADFAKAYDGPPTDPKVFQQQQEELQQQLQKRAKELEDQRKNQQAAPGGTPAPAAPAK